MGGTPHPPVTQVSGHEDKIRDFFVEHKGIALHLPSGWIGGRPHDTHHQLTYVEQRPKRLLIELDDNILISISGSPVVSVRSVDFEDGSRELVLGITQFKSAVVDFLAYGSEKPSCWQIGDGEIAFSAAVDPPDDAQ